MTTLIIPDYDSHLPRPYTGDIQPGEYQGNEIVEVLREHANNPEAVHFIADMMEV